MFSTRNTVITPISALLVSLALILWATPNANAQQPHARRAGDASDDLQRLKETLITANWILDAEGLVTPYGHVSARIPNSDRVLITRSKSPGLVTMDDILVVNLNGEVVEGTGRTYGEVHLHTAIYRARPEVNAVAHTHSDSVVALTMVGAPFRPAMNQAASYIGPAKTYESIGTISNRELGERMADLMGPDNALLLRGHGAVVAGSTIELATMRAVFLERAAKVHWLAMAIGNPAAYTEEELSSISPGNGQRPWEYYSTKARRESRAR